MALEHIEHRATRMRERRDELGLTQEQIAERMQEIHAAHYPDEAPDRTRGQMVSDWERAINDPSPKKIELLAAALDWTVGDLNAGAPDKSATPDVLATLNGADDIRSELGRLVEAVARMDETISELRSDLVDLSNAVADRTTPASRPQRPRRAAGT